MPEHTSTVYTPLSSRLWAAGLDFAVSLMLGMIAATPVGIWYNANHHLNADGNGSTVALWALVIMVLATPLVSQAALSTSPGSLITGSRTRIFGHDLRPVRWYRGLFHAAIFPSLATISYFTTGLWPTLLIIFVGYVLSPLVDPKRRTLNEWLSYTFVLSEKDTVPGAAEPKKIPKATPDVTIGPFSRARRLTYALALVALMGAAIGASFIIAS